MFKIEVIPANVFNMMSEIEMFPPEKSYGVIRLLSPEGHYPELKNNQYFKGIVKIECHDVLKQSNKYIIFNDDHAEEIVAFLNKVKNDIETLYISCDAGLSRSPAVAAAITAILGEDDMIYFIKYLPNNHIYNTILKVYRKGQ
jgi:predicted protein tyrosine phosphatase